MPHPLTTTLVAASLGLTSFLSGFAGTPETDDHWWPKQSRPESLQVLQAGEFVTLARAAGLTDPEDIGRNPYHMLATSLSGLAAQSVNNGAAGPMIWISKRDNASYREWFKRLKERTGLSTSEGKLLTLLSELSAKGVVKGYILYSSNPIDRKEKEGPGDESVNAATMLAGLLQGVLADESIQGDVDRLGLKMLYDARGVKEEAVFEKEKSRLNRHHALIQKPQLPYGRDLAIAHRMPVFYGRESPAPEVYAWMEPIGTVFGWNLDPEDASVGQACEAGHLVIPCDWAPNLPALSIGAADFLASGTVPKFLTPAPVKVPAENSTLGVFMSDGDNLQWVLTTFAHNHSYWANPGRNATPTGWGLPVADLLQMAPDAYNYFVKTQGESSSILLHVGYYYPDTFAIQRGPGERKRLLARLARRIDHTLRISGLSMLTFLAKDLDGAKSREAYEIFAREAPSLRGMFAVQYYPYEGGEGEIVWVPKPDGSKIPMVSASYAMWRASEKRKRGMGPLPLAKALGDRARQSRFDEWLVVHAWSEFPEALTDPKTGHPIGMDPVLRFVSELRESPVTVVPMEQLLKTLSNEAR